jgi:RNA polymerase sigma-70 factor (ECF subfamily)
LAPDVERAIESVFRNESGRITAALIRISGSFDWAEEAMQEAFAAAVVAWRESGLPDNPAAWIMRTAQHKIIDRSRRERTKREKQQILLRESEPYYSPSALTEAEAELVTDERLSLIFTCCHPALNPEAQIALTLRTLGGLTTTEIAKAFLVPEATLAQRLVRAKRKIQEARIPYQVPPPNQLPERLVAVRLVLYLIFNEGYSSATGTQLVRGELCDEAIRLTRVLDQLLPADAETLGLLALMLLHHSRRDARVRDGQLITLEEQDRSLWHAEEAAEGMAILVRALTAGPIGPYQLQAAIAAVHAEAKSASETDWAQIAALYQRLYDLQPSPVIALNHAVAIAMSSGLQRGLERINDLGQALELRQYYLFHAAQADILRRMGRHSEAKQAYERALELVSNAMERDFLTRRLQSLDSH